MVATLPPSLHADILIDVSPMMTDHLNDAELERLMPHSFRRKARKLQHARQRGPRLPGAVLQHGIPARDGEIFNLVFESANSDWEQSVTLVTDKSVRLANRLYNRGVIIHYDSSNFPLRIVVRTGEGML